MTLDHLLLNVPSKADKQIYSSSVFTYLADQTHALTPVFLDPPTVLIV